MLRKTFYLFIFFAPYTSFFALTAWLRLPVIFNQCAFFLLLIAILLSGKVKKKWIEREDLLLIGFLILVWLSFILGFREKRSFNHSLAYTNAIVFYYFTSKYIIEFLGITAIEISRVVYKSFIFCSLIIITDFIAINYFNFSVRKIYSPEVDHLISNMDYYIRDGFIRVGGVAEEPGHMANFYNIYFGISLFYISIKNSFKQYKWIISLFVFSSFALYSNAGIALTLIAFSLILIFKILTKFSISKKLLLFIFILFLLIVIALPFVFIKMDSEQYNQLIDFINKITFNEGHKDYSSSGARLNQWGRALSNFINHPILGNGPGYGVNEDAEGYLSVYLTILSDVGIIALFLFILYQIIILLKTKNLNGNSRDFLFFSVITSFLHLIIIADFYQAPLWILFFLIQKIYNEHKTKNI